MMRLAAIAGAAMLLQQSATFKATVDAVTVDVSVRDGTKVVSNLTAGDFTLLDNGVPQQIAARMASRIMIASAP